MKPFLGLLTLWLGGEFRVWGRFSYWGKEDETVFCEDELRGSGGDRRP
jgi:hypothetical protein